MVGFMFMFMFMCIIRESRPLAESNRFGKSAVGRKYSVWNMEKSLENIPFEIRIILGIDGDSWEYNTFENRCYLFIQPVLLFQFLPKMSKSSVAPETFKTQNTRFLKVMLSTIFFEWKVVTDFFCSFNLDRFLSHPIVYTFRQNYF